MPEDDHSANDAEVAGATATPRPAVALADSEIGASQAELNPALVEASEAVKPSATVAVKGAAPVEATATATKPVIAKVGAPASAAVGKTGGRTGASAAAVQSATFDAAIDDECAPRNKCNRWGNGG